MMVIIGPIIIALILGIIIGSQIKTHNGDTPFLSALIGIFVGKLIFARSK